MSLYESLKFFIDALALGGAMAACLYSWYSQRRKADREEIETVKGRLSHVETEFKVFRERAQSAPTRDDIHQVFNAVTELRGDVRVLAQESKGTSQAIARLEKVIDRHEEHLLGGRP